MEYLQGLQYWHWWVIGLALGALEVFVPGAVFIWFGLAAGVVGLIMLIVDITWQTQVVLFGVLSVLSMVAWRYYARHHRGEHHDYPTLNRRGAHYVGRVFTLEEPIINGHGKVKVDDSTWKVRGPDLATGSAVKVTGVDGTVFIVEAT